MLLFNYLIYILLTINELVNTVLTPFLSYYILEVILITSIIYLASGQSLKGILDTTAKVVTIATGSTVLYNNWVKDSSSDNKDEDKNKKDENKDKKAKEDNKDGSKQGTTDE
jgi:ribosomal protein L12E/L44/L45/RPP1/RPP2